MCFPSSYNGPCECKCGEKQLIKLGLNSLAKQIEEGAWKGAIHDDGPWNLRWVNKEMKTAGTEGQWRGSRVNGL